MDFKIVRKKIFFIEELLEEKYDLIQDNKIFITILQEIKSIIEEIIKETKKTGKITEKDENILELYEELLKIKKTLEEYKKSTTTFYKNKNLYYADEEFNIKKISYEEIQKKIKFLKEKYEKIYEKMLGEN